MSLPVNAVMYTWLVLILCVHTALSARILCYYTVPSISHQIVFRELTKELLRVGHELVVVTPDPYHPVNQTIREIDVSESYEPIRRAVDAIPKHPGPNWELTHDIVFKFLTEAFEIQLRNKEVQELLNNDEKFDLLIIEGIVRPVYFLTHKFKAPVISIGSLTGVRFNYEAVNAPLNAIYPTFHRNDEIKSIWDKLRSMYIDYIDALRYCQTAAEENRIGRKYFGPDVPDIQLLSRNVDLIFTNTNPVWEGVRPVPPSVIYIGGLHLQQPKPLTEELQRHLDGCPQGVVYMSLGTNVVAKDLPKHTLDAIKKVFSELEQCVLFKYEDKIEDIPDNVLLSKWFPQNDLLAHPNIKLFITQGGLQSTDEAINSGVPLVGLPVFADQENNVNKYVDHGIGVKEDIKTLTADRFRRAVRTVLEDDRYRANVVRLRSILHDTPQTPLATAVWWVGYLLRHGSARHLHGIEDRVSLWPLLVAPLAGAALLLLCRARRSKTKRD